MSTATIVVLVLLALLVLLAIGGAVATARRTRAREATVQAQLREANEALAAAHADDKGWERDTMEDAARRAYAERHGGPPAELRLVQVVDRPGTDEDEAVFHADGRELVLGRHDGAWVPR